VEKKSIRTGGGHGGGAGVGTVRGRGRPRKVTAVPGSIPADSQDPGGETGTIEHWMYLGGGVRQMTILCNVFNAWTGVGMIHMWGKLGTEGRTEVTQYLQRGAIVGKMSHYFLLFFLFVSDFYIKI